MSRLVTPAGAKIVFVHDWWALYECKPSRGSSFLWLTFKLMRQDGAAPKWGQVRSFDLRWNPVDGRFAKMRSISTLETLLPDLYERVDLWLSLHRDRAWLETAMGVSVPEIEAERARLAALARARRAEKRAARGA